MNDVWHDVTIVELQDGSEFIEWGRVLTDEELDEVHAWLAKKYGVEVKPIVRIERRKETPMSDLTPNVSSSIPVQHFEDSRTVTPKDIATIVRFLGIEAAAWGVVGDYDESYGPYVHDAIEALRAALEVEL